MPQFLAAVVGFSYVVGSLVCHQLPERSFHPFGVQLPVCARCTGLYAGGAVGFAAWLLLRRLRAGGASLSAGLAARALTLASAPTLVTLVSAGVGWWDPSNIGRALFALPLGATAGAVLGAVVSKNLR